MAGKKRIEEVGADFNISDDKDVDKIGEEIELFKTEEPNIEKSSDNVEVKKESNKYITSGVLTKEVENKELPEITLPLFMHYPSDNLSVKFRGLTYSEVENIKASLMSDSNIFNNIGNFLYRTLVTPGKVTNTKEIENRFINRAELWAKQFWTKHEMFSAIYDFEIDYLLWANLNFNYSKTIPQEYDCFLCNKKHNKDYSIDDVMLNLDNFDEEGLMKYVKGDFPVEIENDFIVYLKLPTLSDLIHAEKNALTDFYGYIAKVQKNGREYKNSDTIKSVFDNVFGGKLSKVTDEITNIKKLSRTKFTYKTICPNKDEEVIVDVNIYESFFRTLVIR
jgi:hypothetical protein